MKEKTKLQIIDKISSFMKFEGKQQGLQKFTVLLIYILEAFIFQICLLVSIVEPELQLSEKMIGQTQIEVILTVPRLVVPLIYMVTTSVYLIPLIKLMQILGVYLTRNGIFALPLILQLLAESYYILRKQKRNLNFDSRLEYFQLGVKIFAVYLLLLTTFITPTAQIHNNPSAVFFCAIIYCVGAYMDSIYSYRTKQRLSSLALLPIFFSIYFLFLPLVPVFNNISLATHGSLSTGLFCVLVFYIFQINNEFKSEILYKKLLNLQTREKVNYLWNLIYFTENTNRNDMLCFIKTHQKQCLNSLCPLNYHVRSYDQDTIQKAIKIYLSKALERFASESSEIRRLFIFYRKQDDPKILHLFRQDDIYEMMEEKRINKNFKHYEDASIQYEQMKLIQEQTLKNVKLYLNHYDYFLTYISKDRINMQTGEQIIEELLTLKKYFLSFNPVASLTNNKSSVIVGSQKNFKIKKGYQKIQVDTIPIRKMTLKTTTLVNFMRKVYFNLPLLERQESDYKKIKYIDEDLEQDAILVISAESYNLGKIINWNTMAQKQLLYSTKQLKNKFVNDFVPKEMHQAHNKIFMKAASSLQISGRQNNLATSIFCRTKSSYTQIYKIAIQAINSISGNRWIAELKQQFPYDSCIIVDENCKIIGINRNAINMGINLNWCGCQMQEQVFKELLNKKQKINFEKSVQVIKEREFLFETKWELVSTTPYIDQMPKYFIFTVQKAHSIEMMTLSRFSKKNKEQELEVTQPKNGFQFNFDPIALKFTNQGVVSSTNNEIKNAWQDQFVIQNHDYVNIQPLSTQKYGQNIHQMIYFNQKLEFKENYDVATDFQTHPNYLNETILSSMKNPLGIEKNNFIQNVRKIQSKTPTFIYKLIAFYVLLTLAFIIQQSFRYMELEKLYKLTQEKELVQMQIINRKNLQEQIGSLALYNDKVEQNSKIWQIYATNRWSFEELFVEIEYSNANINGLNPQIGLLVQKEYLLKGQSQKLSSIFEKLSIQASTQLTGELNLTDFITKIVDDIAILQEYIWNDTQQYYADGTTRCKLNLKILDCFFIGLLIIFIIVVHLTLRSTYWEKVYIFKSISVIEDEQLQRIQKNLNQHKEEIKRNELETIQEDDYSQTVTSQYIPHNRKVLQSYFKSKLIFFYPLILIWIILAAVFFFASFSFVKEKEKIEIIQPFVNIVGDLRKSMGKMYLNILAKTKTDQEINEKISQLISSFEVNKKGIIQSLIQKQFSTEFMTFYNKIWFNSCQYLGVAQECKELFSGILGNNLDYNYVYIISESQKILSYRQQMTSAINSTNSDYIDALKVELSISKQKINFLLYKFMVKLLDEVNSHIVEELSILHKRVDNNNLYFYLGMLLTSLISSGFSIWLIYKLRNYEHDIIEKVTCVIPFHILMRNIYFTEWYRKKFSHVY